LANRSIEVSCLLTGITGQSKGKVLI